MAQLALRLIRRCDSAAQAVSRWFYPFLRNTPVCPTHRIPHFFNWLDVLKSAPFSGPPSFPSSTWFLRPMSLPLPITIGSVVLQDTSFARHTPRDHSPVTSVAIGRIYCWRCGLKSKTMYRLAIFTVFHLSLFPLFIFWFRATYVSFRAHVKTAYRIVSYRMGTRLSDHTILA